MGLRQHAAEKPAVCGPAVMILSSSRFWDFVSFDFRPGGFRDTIPSGPFSRKFPNHRQTVLSWTFRTDAISENECPSGMARIAMTRFAPRRSPFFPACPRISSRLPRVVFVSMIRTFSSCPDAEFPIFSGQAPYPAVREEI